jgi:hypothetical protein
MQRGPEGHTQHTKGSARRVDAGPAGTPAHGEEVDECTWKGARATGGEETTIVERNKENQRQFALSMQTDY